jgi:hypothetical protein
MVARCYTKGPNLPLECDLIHVTISSQAYVCLHILFYDKLYVHITFHLLAAITSTVEFF